MVAKHHGAKLKHRVAGTRDEFWKHLLAWDKQDKHFCFVHLWLHGSRGSVSVGSSDIGLVDILDSHSHHPYDWKNCVVHFGACSTMDAERSDLREFLNRTELSAIS
ncbi:MAG: hypothetical protein F4089_16280, partial [Gammaproteobacteria bacterium]|nr:hypothetical protein [Gammaproteobacteria bacterium]